MPGVSKLTASQDVDHGVVHDRCDELGEYTVNFVEFREDIDASPLLKGLPDDRCPCPHWGYVIKGRITYRFEDGEEVFHAGDAFYLPPGHAPIGHEPGSQMVQFSPTELLHQVQAVMAGNMEALNSG